MGVARVMIACIRKCYTGDRGSQRKPKGEEGSRVG